MATPSPLIARGKPLTIWSIFTMISQEILLTKQKVSSWAKKAHLAQAELDLILKTHWNTDNEFSSVSIKNSMHMLSCKIIVCNWMTPAYIMHER